MKEILKQAFPNCATNDCLKAENALYFEVFDPSSEDDTLKTPCYLVYESGKGHFQVKNNAGKMIHFAAVDNCIFTDNTHKKCDFMLFDDKVFCFADIKNVKTSQRKHAKKDAKEQIETTIALFLSKIDLSNYEIKAVIALTFQQTYPIAKVSTQDAKIRFEDKFKAMLYEGNRIDFE